MILAVNVGNTHITIGGYQEDQRVFSARLRTSLQCSSDEYAIKLLDLLRLHQIPRSRLSGAILSSVVPAISGVVLVALGKLCPMRVLTIGPGLKSGVRIRMDNPAQLGGELLCAIVGALQHCAPPCVVVNFDTATTLLAVDAAGALVGGSILPGPQCSLSALVRNTAQLPQVELEARPRRLLGANTADCLHSGIVYGTAAMLDGVIDRIRETLHGAEPSIVATGPNAPVIARYCRNRVVYDKYLLMEGLYAIYQKNCK